MTVDPRLREEAVVERLRARWLDRGYQVFVHPKANLLPPFFGTWRPAAIAIPPQGQGQPIAFAVKAGPDSTREPLRSIAEKFAGREDWRLVVVDASDVRDPEIGLSTPAELTQAAEAALDLIRTGVIAPGLLAAWSAIEGLARHAGNARDSRVLRDPHALVDWLVQNGHVEADDRHRAMALADARLRAAHGDFSIGMDEGERTLIADIVTALAEAAKAPHVD